MERLDLNLIKEKREEQKYFEFEFLIYIVLKVKTKGAVYLLLVHSEDHAPLTI